MEYLRTWAEINLDNALINCKRLKEKAGDDVFLSAVIKADAYGHGSAAYAHTLKDEAEFFAVATAEEAVILRESGIKKPIHILGYVHPSQFSYVTDFNLCVTTYNSQNATALSEHAQAVGKEIYVFLAIDTGMQRIGFKCDENSIDEIDKIYNLPNIQVLGIFTHLAKADESDKTSANLQIKKFSELISTLEQKGISITYKSVYNSAGIIDFGKNFNLVRAGISLYGIYPSNEVRQDEVKLLPVLSLKTRIVHLHDLKKGEGISYGHTFVAKKDMRVATLSAGYADGINRLLSNNGRVLINGEYAPIIGRVCMDFFMVDVSLINNVKLDDIATIIGKDGENEILAAELAENAQTIAYEITCSISKRVPRVYFLGGERKFFD